MTSIKLFSLLIVITLSSVSACTINLGTNAPSAPDANAKTTANTAANTAVNNNTAQTAPSPEAVASVAPKAQASPKPSVAAKSAATHETPQSAVNALLTAWRAKDQAGIKRVVEAGAVGNLMNFIPGTKLKSCEADTESARQTYNCTVQAGDDDLTAVFLEVTRTRNGYMIMSVDHAAAH